MTENQDNGNKSENHAEEPEVVEETFYDEDDPQSSQPWEENEKQDMGDKVFNRIAGCVPVDVAEHLNNSRKELVKAGIALGNNQLKHADEFMDRVRKAHSEK